MSHLITVTKILFVILFFCYLVIKLSLMEMQTI
jgi:hypothetical protein